MAGCGAADDVSPSLRDANSVVPVAKESGAQVIILNAEPTEMDSLADVLLRGSISEVLPQIIGGAAA